QRQKCDGMRPVCRQCSKMDRADACAYDDKQQKSRTMLLKEQIFQLERYLHDLESSSGSGSSSGAPSSPCNVELDSRFSPVSDDSRASNRQFPSYTFASTSVSPSPPHSEASSIAPSMLLNPTEHRVKSEDSASCSSSASSLAGPSHTDPGRTLSPRAKQFLLDIFFAHRHQFCFYASVDRFHEPFQPGNEPHPALVNAIYLLACHFANSQIYTDLEFPFYTQTQHEINVALDTSDRLPDIVQASALLAIYLFMNNRVMEGYRHTFSAIKLAVGTGLHQIQPQSVLTGIYPAHAPLIPILPPRDAMELQDRILAFWQIFTIDRCWSAANNLPLALSDKDTPQCRILTPWPLEASKWDAIGFQPPLRAFFDGAELSDPSEETIPSLKAKAAVLYELTSRSKDGSDPNGWTYRFSEDALHRFSSTIPSVPLNCEYLVIQTMIYTSFIHLRRHVTSDGRALKAGHSIVQLICQLTDADWPCLDPIISACWLSVAEMFIIAIAHLKLDTSSGDLSNVISGYRHNLNVLVQALTTFGTYFALSGEFASKVELACG
ncbi:hypothetical protein J132_04012, partial [Termitomyces sp. J132]